LLLPAGQLALVPPGAAVAIRYPVALTANEEQIINRAKGTDMCWGTFEVTDFASDIAYQDFDFSCHLLQSYLKRIAERRVRG
jgi:hypothetical protein